MQMAQITMAIVVNYTNYTALLLLFAVVEEVLRSFTKVKVVKPQYKNTQHVKSCIKHEILSANCTKLIKSEIIQLCRNTKESYYYIGLLSLMH